MSEQQTAVHQPQLILHRWIAVACHRDYALLLLAILQLPERGGEHRDKLQYRGDVYCFEIRSDKRVDRDDLFWIGIIDTNPRERVHGAGKREHLGTDEEPNDPGNKCST